jgi:hypothetical protein
VLVEIKLVERDRYLRLPEQFAQTSYSPSMLRAFVTIADENVLQHG